MSDFTDKYINAALIPFRLNMCIDSCYERDAWRFSLEWNNCVKELEYLINNISDEPGSLTEKIRAQGAEIQSNVNDYVLCASVIQNEILPLVYEELNKCEVSISYYNDFEVIGTKIGLFTLMDKVTGKLYHNINDPMKEAQHQADYLFNATSENIVICGAGLGYLPYLLWEKSLRSTNVYILEKKLESIEIAKKYGVLNRIDEDKLHIIVTENEDELLTALNELPIDLDSAISWVSDWFVDSIEDNTIRDIIMNFSENIMSQRRFELRHKVNSRCNRQNALGDISMMGGSPIMDAGSEVLVVAPGPSLDKSIEYIINSEEKMVIIAVDAAMRNLLVHDIKPDYVVLLDPNDTVMRYLVGIEDMTQDITLIAYEKAYWKYVAEFKGKVYCVEEKSDADESDIHYAVNNCTTVSSMAIQVALFLGAKEINLVGLDLSYPGGQIFAGQGAVINNVRAGMMTRSVCGDLVATSEIFKEFKNEIENIIRANPSVRFINHSAEGAFIQGTLMGQWWEKTPNDYIGYIDQLKRERILVWDEKYYLMWQIICKYLKETESENKAEVFWNKIADLYNSILEEFIGCVGTINRIEVGNQRFVILLTSMYSFGSDEISDKVREDAFLLKSKHGIDVMIVNTREYLGGTKVAIDEHEVWDEFESPVNSQSIFYMGERFSYFSFDEGMPNIEQAMAFIQAISEKMPMSFIAYDSLSLIAGLCKQIGNVEYR